MRYKHNIKEDSGLFYMCIAKSKASSKKKFTKKHVIDILRTGSHKVLNLNHKKKNYETKK